MENRQHRSSRRRLVSWTVKAVSLALAGWLVLRLLAGLEWADVAARVGEADRLWLAAALAALVGRFLPWDQRWREALARAGPLPRRRVTFAALLASAAVNSITPTVRVVGGVLRGRWVGRAVGLSLGRAYGSVLYDQVAHQAVMSAMTVVALVGALAVGGRPTAALALAAVAAAAGTAAALWLRRRRGGRRELIRRFAERLVRKAGEGGALERLVAHGRDAIEVMVALLGDAGLLRRVVALGAAFFVLNAGAQWLVFLALGDRVSPWAVLAVVALGAAAGIAVGTPGGLGAAEAAMIAGFTALGVDRLDATAGTLLFRALHFLVVLGLGLPSLAWLELGAPRRGAGAGADAGAAGGPS